MEKLSVTNVLGVAYHHYKVPEGGDLYLTRFGEALRKYMDLDKWYEKDWFTAKRQKLLGTSAVYKVPTKEVDGSSLNLVVKYSRVGEDIPFNTRMLEEYCNAEFNSPWEEFALVMEILDAAPDVNFNTQEPLAIYVPSETMQLWQSGRSRHRISRIRARHPGIDLDILKQYVLVYGWIEGKNLIEIFNTMDVDMPEAVEDLKALDARATELMAERGYYVADMKPEHVIIRQSDAERIISMKGAEPQKQVSAIHDVLDANAHAIIDYELLYRTPEHNERIQRQRRSSYLGYQKSRFEKVMGYPGLLSTEVMGVPYIFGHVESTGGKLWVTGNNAMLFDYFLPERWRKTNALSMSENNEVFYTVTKDNVHVVWKTSRVGELGFPDNASGEPVSINSPFEEAALAFELQKLGVSTVYFRAIYMTGTPKVEKSQDSTKYTSHEHLLDPEGNCILSRDYNYITVRGYFNGTDEWVHEHEDALFTPVDLDKARHLGIITDEDREVVLCETVAELAHRGFNGRRLRHNDILLAIDGGGAILRKGDGRADGIICNLEFITRLKTDR